MGRREKGRQLDVEGQAGRLTRPGCTADRLNKALNSSYKSYYPQILVAIPSTALKSYVDKSPI